MVKYITATALLAGSAHAAPLLSTTATTTFHKADIDGVGVCYREAGPVNAATILLLHGFPSSSREFDTLIPFLATHYHVIAPDYPGFGLSDAPPASSYGYTFDHLAEMMSALLDKLRISRCTMYLHDYGAPIGFRMIMAHPERLQKLIMQNGNIYQAGLGAKWTKIAEYWADPKASEQTCHSGPYGRCIFSFCTLPSIRSRSPLFVSARLAQPGRSDSDRRSALRAYAAYRRSSR